MLFLPPCMDITSLVFNPGLWSSSQHCEGTQNITLIFSYCRFKVSISDSQGWMPWTCTSSRLKKGLQLDREIASTCYWYRGCFSLCLLCQIVWVTGNMVIGPHSSLWIWCTCTFWRMNLWSDDTKEKMEFQLNCPISPNWKRYRFWQHKMERKKKREKKKGIMV